MTGWQLLQTGDFQKAIATFKEECSTKPKQLGPRTNIGIAMLCLGVPHEALQVFENILASFPNSSRLHGWAGVACWLLENRNDAVQYWSAGLGCDYTDAAGGMDLPLLLYFASIMDSTLFEREQAMLMMRERLLFREFENWPAVIARFLVGDTTAEEAMRHAVYKESVGQMVPWHQDVAQRNVTRVHFYMGVDCLSKDDYSGFREQLSLCVQSPKCELVQERYLGAHFLRGRTSDIR
jgi:hypothetical protein